MLTIASLFGKSPFAPLQKHMDNVASCIEKLPELFDSVDQKNIQNIEAISKEISKREHEADLTKNDIRNHLPKGLFLQVDRATLLEILALQDAIADKAEDIGILLTLAVLENYQDLKQDFTNFYQKNIEAFWLVREVIQELEELIECSFGGPQAEKVKNMIEGIAKKEHELDRQQYSLVKKLYALGDKIPYQTFHLWLSLLREVGAISNLSEKLANRVRMMLEIK